MINYSIENYCNFGVISSLLLNFFLIFHGSSNYYYPNFVIITNIFIIFFITCSFVIKNLNINFTSRTFSLNLIDFLLFADLAFNFIMTFFSRHPRVSIEDFIYQTSYFTIYLIFRICVSIKPEIYLSYFNILRILSVAFTVKIIYIVFYQFQMISADGRINYNSMHPNLLASTFIIMAAAFLYFIVNDILNKNVSISTFSNAFVIIVLLFLVVMTSSRGGMLGFAIGIITVFSLLSANFKSLFKKSYIISGLIVITVFLAFFLPNHLDRIKSLFKTGTVMSLGSRINIWQSALNLFIKHPLFGVGPAACNYEIQTISNSSMVDAHNFLLEKLCNVGTIGTILYLFPLILIFRYIFKAHKSNSLYNNHFMSLSYTILFLLIALFTNSSFSPHYVLPLLSMMLYSFLGIYVALINFESPSTVIANSESFPSSLNKLIILLNVSIASYIFYFLLFSPLDFLLKSEISIWLIPMALLSGSLLYFFKFFKISPSANIKIETGVKINARLKFCLITILLFIIFSFSFGFKYYVAEKANGLGITSVMKYSVKPALKYFDIALENDPTNIAYLINKSNLLFISEAIKTPKLENNINIKNALVMSNKTLELFSSDQLLHNNNALIKSKFEGNSNATSAQAGDSSLSVDTMDIQLVLQSGRQSLSKYADVFKTKAYIKFKKAIEKIKGPILEKIKSETDIDMLSAEENEHLAFLASILNLCTNFDLPFIDGYIVNDIGNTMKATEIGSKNIPFKSFKQYSKQMQLQNEALSNVVILLPTIWKYSNKMSSQTNKKYMAEFFGSDQLFPIINYFIYNDDNSYNNFKDFDTNLKLYLYGLVCLANGSYESAIQSHENVIKKYDQANAVKLSWLYYKAGKLSQARDMVFYSQINTILASRRDFTYKRDLLFGGNLLSFYYLPLQAYYNEFIMLALIKMHNGDHTMVLKEVFDYLNKVVYSQ